MPENNSPITQDSTPVIVPGAVTPTETLVKTDFLSGTETAQRDALYADLFEKNKNSGANAKPKKSILELIISVMNFIMPIAVTLAVLGGVHALIRSQESNSIATNFPFLCGYLHQGIHTDDPNYSCQTAQFITTDVTEKKSKLEKDIVNQLALYIPIKVSAAAADRAPESTRAKEIFADKINANDIIAQFNAIKKSSEAIGTQNISCPTMNLTDGHVLTVQCSVYGADIGADETK